MSVLLNFAIFPLDKKTDGGGGGSEYVSKVLKMIRESGVSYKLNSMGTTIETDTMEEALHIVNESYKILEPFSKRIYATINIDAKKGRKNGISQKIESIEKRIGKVSIDSPSTTK